MSGLAAAAVPIAPSRLKVPEGTGEPVGGSEACLFQEDGTRGSGAVREFSPEQGLEVDSFGLGPPAGAS